MTITAESCKIIVKEVHQHSRSMQEIQTPTGADVYLLGLPLSHGVAEVYSENKRVWNGLVHPGTIGFLSPSVELRSLIKEPWHSLRLFIPGACFREMFADQTNLLAGARFLRTPHKEIVALGRQLLLTATLDRLHHQLFADGFIRILMACLAQGQERISRSSRSPPLFGNKEINRCVEFAEAHYEAELDLGQWSAAMELSQAEFSRRFRATTGKSPYRWFLDRRLDRAKEKLLTTDSSIVEIAHSLGFVSQSHFCEAFRRYCRHTPSHWRTTYSREARSRWPVAS